MVTQEQANIFLDALQRSGKTNMFGASPYVQKHFSCSSNEARELLATWMRTYDERHPS